MFPFVLQADRKLQSDEVEALMAFYNGYVNEGPALTTQQVEILARLGFLVPEPLEVNTNELPQA